MKIMLGLLLMTAVIAYGLFISNQVENSESLILTDPHGNKAIIHCETKTIIKNCNAYDLRLDVITD